MLVLLDAALLPGMKAASHGPPRAVGRQRRGQEFPCRPMLHRGQCAKGVAMKKFLVIALGAMLSLAAASGSARATWSSCHYGGYQPWWNIFAHRHHSLTC